MNKRTIGSLEVSVVGLGCNNFGRRVDAQQTKAVVDEALACDINFFDTADIYGTGESEELLGRALGPRRPDVVIATKFGMEMGPDRKGGSARWIRTAVEDSLRRLGTDVIDLYQMHAPDPDVPIEETLGTLDELVRAGKVREIGCSNFSGAQIEQADTVSRDEGLARFVSEQSQYSLLRREVESDVLPACERMGLSFLPYFPLASGMLTGKYRRGENPPEGTRLATAAPDRVSQLMSDRSFEIVEKLEAFASERGRTLLELAMSWLAGRPMVASVIAGATKPEQVTSNSQAAGWVLSDEEGAEVDAITAGG
ncbi:MAG TPA: aldo/keto reductase [Actinomycetota bacterium]|nr:aldo/keto reductase [Actinomycetota bacterium]